MAKYTVPLWGYANTAVEVETDSTDLNEIAALAELQAHATLCHQCAHNVDLGDEWQPVMYEGKPEVYKEDE
ncbi:hypothetical protein AB0D68_11070 [Streptomyces sp. NPDC048212]|uniref:hypothetical protein n=1 Tax=Streptomyces sp. NPDC048212 TaxID=3156658 RepID=UPI0033DBD642